MQVSWLCFRVVLDAPVPQIPQGVGGVICEVYSPNTFVGLFHIPKPHSPEPTRCWGLYLWGCSPNTGCSWGYFTSQGPDPQNPQGVWGALGVISCPKILFPHTGCLGCLWVFFTSQGPIPIHGVFGVPMGLFHIPRSCSHTWGVWGACGIISHPKVPFPHTGCLGCPRGYFTSRCPCGGRAAGCPPGEALGAAFPVL